MCALMPAAYINNIIAGEGGVHIYNKVIWFNERDLIILLSPHNVLKHIIDIVEECIYWSPR